MPRLENWLWFGKQMVGDCYNDEKGRFEDGDRIVTTEVVQHNEAEGWIQTKNTKYVLGQPLGAPGDKAGAEDTVQANREEQMEFDFVSGKTDPKPD